VLLSVFFVFYAHSLYYNYLMVIELRMNQYAGVLSFSSLGYGVSLFFLIFS